MNFEWDGALASRQDRVATALTSDKEPSADDWAALKGNWIVPIAALLAPSNLTVRHYCLLDLLSDKPEHIKRIMSQCNRLMCATADSFILWSEGYSYWEYTRPILDLFAKRFHPTFMTPFMTAVDINFEKTAYVRDGKLYPVQLGDLWDSPMYDIFKPGIVVPRETIHVHSRACGFNLHTDRVDVTYAFDSPPEPGFNKGIPYDKATGFPFVFYEGYEKKYPTKWKEIKALCRRAVLILTGRNK